MAPYVEANSLSDITQLASNPPKYPRNPTEKKRDPLTLYIARVPGSRDIILTTLKPQLKNVTAEDVASSLYYLHLHSEEDAKLLEQDPDVIVEQEEPNEAKQRPVPRKPLPEPARSSLDLNQQLQSIPEPPPRSGPPQEISRKALPTEVTAAIHGQGKEVQRKPLGPRPLLSEPSIERKPLRGTENQPLTSKPGAQEVITSSSGIGNVEISNSLPPEEENGHHLQEAKRTFSITIIRRDPSSGAQWNIGSVHGEAQPKPSHSKKPYFDISVHLSTPGYIRFKDSQPTLSSGVGNSGIGTSSSAAVPPHKDIQPQSEPGFDRQIRMEGTSFWNRPKQHKRSHSDTSEIRNPARGRSDSLFPDGMSENATKDPELGTKGYAFGSPWGGRCKFATSSSGRTLRCKHTLPGPISSTNMAESGTFSHATVVSELRFNLPSLIKFQANNSASTVKSQVAEFGRFQIPTFGHIRNKLSPDKLSRPPLSTRPHPTSYASMYPNDDEDRPPLPPRPFQNSYATESSDEDVEAPPLPPRVTSDEDEGRLDLSIGQEKAGGGNRGKRAKLGKLIILDEGFKMLDLVVAANMGVWWSVWEPNIS